MTSPLTVKPHRKIAFPLLALILAAFCVASLIASARQSSAQSSGFITTADGVKIHYLKAGQSQVSAAITAGGPSPDGKVTNNTISVTNMHQQPSILFIPGWTMPAWIWQKQIDYFSKNYRVVAMDPRSQGESSRTGEGLYPAARARDIKAVVDQLHLAPVVLIGWSMAVTEVAAYVDQFGTRDIAGLVFVDDDFGGLTPAAAKGDMEFINQILTDRQKTTSEFIRNVFFKKPQPPGYVDRVIAASLRVPTSDAVALLLGKFAADYRSAAAKMDKPTLFCYADSPYMTPEEQKKIQASVKGAELEIFRGAGHTLFVDDADHFNSVLSRFLSGLP